MRIEKISLIHLRVVLKRPFILAGKLVNERDFLLLKVVSGSRVGWGEASPETVSLPDLMLDFKRNLVPFALQMPFDALEDFSHSLSVMKASPEARAGLEMAAWNLLAQGKEAASPKERLSATIGKILEAGEESEMADSLILAARAGQTPAVLKVNPGNIQTIARVLQNCEENIPIILDAEESFSLENAGDLKHLPDRSVQFVVDPISSENWENVRFLKEKWPVPIALKNSLIDILEVEKIVQAPYVDAVCIDPWRVGGLTAARRYLTVASENKKPAYIFSQLHLDIGTAEVLMVLSSFSRNRPVFTTIPEDVFGTKFIPDSILHFQGHLARFPVEAPIHLNGAENQIDRFRITEEEYW
ncbi:MAG: hypothetical protein GXO76_14725 [Calditrichaeota bacterium]|nr:hypothetical protein [Calditrichota bacterium]